MNNSRSAPWKKNIGMIRLINIVVSKNVAKKMKAEEVPAH